MGKDLRGKELGEGILQTKSGTYKARLRCKNGNRITKTFDKLTEARAWLIDARYEEEHLGIATGADMMVDSWFEYWINEIIGPRLKYNTLVSYKGRYNNRISPIIGKMPLTDVLPIHCQQAINYAQAEGDVPGSVAKIKSIMGAVFEAAVENQLIHVNPVTSSIKYVHGSAPIRTILTVDQQRDFLDKGSRYAHFDEFVFVLNTGLRCGEMCALRWQDIDWNNRVIHINGTMYFNQDKHQFEVNSPKTEAGIRTIPLKDEAIEILKKMKKLRSERPISMMYRDFVFVGREGKPLKTYAYNKSLARIGKKIGVDKLTMHSLRHTFATRCIEDGMKPNVLQKLLGHSTIAMTMDLYVHVTDDERISEMNKVSFPSAKEA